MKRNSFKKVGSTALAVFMATMMICSSTVNAATTPTGKRLKDIQSRVTIGTEFPSNFTSMSDSAQFLSTAKAEFNLVTPENCMKWDATEPNQNQFNFNAANTLVNWAAQNNYKVHGHALVWHSQTPNWVQNLNAANMESAMYNHIEKVMGQYKGKIPMWDVVNEAFEENGSYRNSFWYRTMGKTFIEKAFTKARTVDPNCKLIYNDYNLEYTGAKSDGAYAMLKDFKSRNIPVDGIGFQMHLDIQYAIDYNDFAKNLQRFADLGLEIYVTEMDVRVPQNPSSADLEKQASYYKNIIEKCMAQPAVKAIQVWGFTDKYSWVPGTFPGRDDGLIFDRNYNPKPAYYAMQAAIGTSAPIPVIYGDVDGSGTVDALDFSLMKQYLLGSITTFPAANGLTLGDVDKSGKIDSLDFALMKQYLLKIIPAFPAAV